MAAELENLITAATRAPRPLRNHFDSFLMFEQQVLFEKRTTPNMAAIRGRKLFINVPHRGRVARNSQ